MQSWSCGPRTVEQPQQECCNMVSCGTATSVGSLCSLPASVKADKAALISLEHTSRIRTIRMKRSHQVGAVGADCASAIDDEREVIDHRGHASGFAREGEGTVALGA